MALTNNIGVYWDQNCTKPVTSINWGVLSPGENKSITLYVRNENNINITLMIDAINWKPEEAREFLTLSYAQNNITIEPQKPIKVILILQIKQDIENIKEFSFDILFEGKSQESSPADSNNAEIPTYTSTSIILLILLATLFTAIIYKAKRKIP